MVGGRYSAVLGRADGVKGYHDITRYPDARLIPGLVLFRWDAPSVLRQRRVVPGESVLDAVASIRQRRCDGWWFPPSP